MRTTFIAFWRSTALWTALLALGLLIVSAVSGSLSRASELAPTWFTTALVLAAYPGGLAAADHAFEDGLRNSARLLGFLAGALAASALLFTLANLVIPLLIDSGSGDILGGTQGLTLDELKAATVAARQTAESGPATPETWIPYNRLAFDYLRRLDGTLLPALFAVVGLLAGFWTRRQMPTRLRSLLVWGLGAFLIVTTYMAGENGYELIVLRAAGPVEFAADLVLIVPATLIVALAFCTLADLFEGPDHL